MDRPAKPNLSQLLELQQVSGNVCLDRVVVRWNNAVQLKGGGGWLLVVSTDLLLSHGNPSILPHVYGSINLPHGVQTLYLGTKLLEAMASPFCHFDIVHIHRGKWVLQRLFLVSLFSTTSPSLFSFSTLVPATVSSRCSWLLS